MNISPMIDLNHGQDWHLWNFCFTLWKFKNFSATQKLKTRPESTAQIGSDQNPLPKMGLTRIHCPKWVWSESTAQNGSYQLISVLGATTIRLEMPGHMQNSLIFHYNLKFYGKDTDNYEGISLKRFVMQVSDQFDEKLCKFWYYKGDQNCTLFYTVLFLVLLESKLGCRGL